MVNKQEFLEIKEKYLSQKKRFEEIKKGQLVWESVPRGGEMDYHPAVVIGVNVDKNYVDVIDVSVPNTENKRYSFFYTEEEMIKDGFSKESIKEVYEMYSKTIEDVLK